MLSICLFVCLFVSLSVCRQNAPGEFNVMIPELPVTLQGAAATWWIRGHDSRATCHIAWCSHLTKSVSWWCHIHPTLEGVIIPSAILKIVFAIFFLKNAVWALTSGGFRIVSDTLVIIILYKQRVDKAHKTQWCHTDERSVYGLTRACYSFNRRKMNINTNDYRLDGTTLSFRPIGKNLETAEYVASMRSKY